MSKSEVYSWRLTPELKAGLEAAARREKTTVSELLERVMRGWLIGQKPDPASDAAEQKRLHDAMMACAGVLHGDGTSATNARVREVIGARLEAKYGKRAR